uniref:Abi_HHR domain-containing protein n=1 Tax=Panagrellus redivivus TaxID=6233 RepID=A0A7E4US01_PANRE
MSYSHSGASHAPSLYGVVELDANLKNTIQSLETATYELQKLAALDLDYKMPGLAAFRQDTEQMINLLHGVCTKVEDALNERHNESQIIMNSSADMNSAPSSVGSTSGASTTAPSTSTASLVPATTQTKAYASVKAVPSVVVYDFEVRLKVTPRDK